MAYLTGRLVQIVFPQNGTTDVELDATIKIMFSKDMNVSSINENTIRLVDPDGKIVACSVSMDASDPSRLAIATPKEKLLPETRYQVFVLGGENGVRTVDISGDGGLLMYTDYIWNFTTGNVNVLPAPLTVAPANNSIKTDANISFSWEAVSGASRYQLQISETSNFSIAFFDENDISTTTYIPYTDIEPPYKVPCNYYWRIRAIDSLGNPGTWSAVCQFYIEEAIEQDIEYIYSPLTVVDTFPAAGEAEVDISNNTIVVEFSNELDPSTVIPENLFIKAKDIDGGLPTTDMEGTLEVFSNKVAFTFSESLKENTEYTVYIGKNISDKNGTPFGEESVFMFSTIPSPYYSFVEMVRNDLGKFIEEFSDIEISRNIYVVSLWADQISNKPYGSVNSDFAGNTQSKTTNKIFFHEYVRYETDLRLLMRKALEHSITKGESVTLGDFHKEDTGSLVPELNITMKRLESARDVALEKLTTGQGTSTIPTFARLGGSGDPYPFSGRNF